jgi:hypothetical protein
VHLLGLVHAQDQCWAEAAACLRRAVEIDPSRISWHTDLATVVVEAMAAGRIAEGVELLGSQNRIHSIEDRGERLNAIARVCAASPEGALVMSPDNTSRKELNAAIRTELRDAGQLGHDVYRSPVLVSRQDLTSEDRGIASSYHLGDSVRYLRGSAVLGIAPKSSRP